MSSTTSICTHDCTSTHPSNNIIKFADDTVVGLITGGDESAYQDEVERLTVWCTENNLILNTTETLEIVLDFRRRKEAIQPLPRRGMCGEGLQLSDLTWSTNTRAIIKKGQQRLYFLRTLRNNHLSQRLLVSFYRCSIEHPHVLYLRVVLQLHCSRQKGTPEGRHHSPEDHHQPPPLFTGTI